MSTSYYLIDKDSLERSKLHKKQVAEFIASVKELAKDKFTLADSDDVESELFSLEWRIEDIISAYEQDICNVRANRCSWRMSKEKLIEEYKTGYYVIQDEYEQEYTLEEFMRKVEGYHGL